MSGPSLSVRELIRNRAGNLCEKCGEIPDLNPEGVSRGTIHHRRMRRLGGDHSISNLVFLCIPCHRGIHDQEPLAALTGWVAWADPEVAPVRLASGAWVLLVPDGTYEPLEPVEAIRLLDWVNGSTQAA